MSEHSTLYQEHVLLGASFEESAVTGGPLVLAYAGEKNLDLSGARRGGPPRQVRCGSRR